MFFDLFKRPFFFIVGVVFFGISFSLVYDVWYSDDHLYEVIFHLVMLFVSFIVMFGSLCSAFERDSYSKEGWISPEVCDFIYPIGGFIVIFLIIFRLIPILYHSL